MPILTIQGMPEKATDLEVLMLQIQKAVASVEALEVTEEQTTVCFPVDRLKQRRCEIIVNVLILHKPKRTPHVRQALANTIAGVIKWYCGTRSIDFDVLEVVLTRSEVNDGYFFEKKAA